MVLPVIATKIKVRAGAVSKRVVILAKARNNDALWESIDVILGFAGSAARKSRGIYQHACLGHSALPRINNDSH
jgi:hypothetical protein